MTLAHGAYRHAFYCRSHGMHLVKSSLWCDHASLRQAGKVAAQTCGHLVQVHYR